MQNEGGDDIMIQLYKHQQKALELTKDYNRCAYYLDMG